MVKKKFILLFVIIFTLLVAGCTSSSSTNPTHLSTTTAPSGSYRIVSPVPQSPQVSPTTAQKPLLGAAISKSMMKNGDVFIIQGPAEGTTAITVDIVIHRCKSPNSCSTFDPAFTPRTYHPEVINSKYSQSLNAAEFGPGEFHTVITNPSTGQYTNLRFFIE